MEHLFFLFKNYLCSTLFFFREKVYNMDEGRKEMLRNGEFYEEKDSEKAYFSI